MSTLNIFLFSGLPASCPIFLNTIYERYMIYEVSLGKIFKSTVFSSNANSFYLVRLQCVFYPIDFPL